MLTSSSSAQQARQALADRLREIRLDARLTAKDLATAAGWHRTKVSKLEHAVTSPSADDIQVWCELCGAADQIADLTASLRAVDSTWTQWRRLERAGLRKAQEAVIPLWERTRRFRVYSSWLIPGPVQTEPYIRALLEQVAQQRPGSVGDIDEAVAVRVTKQHVVHEGDHRFAIVLEEAALRSPLGGAEVMAGQLGHLLTAMSLPSISLGVIPLDIDRSRMTPVEGFFLFDHAQVNVELVSGWLRVTTPSEIAMYAQTFAELAELAVYSSEARALITAAIDALD